MKLAHIFEATERGQQGIAKPEQKPQGIPFDQASAKLEEYADGQETFFFDDIDITDENGQDDYPTAVVAKLTHYEHQAPHKGSAWSVDSDVDYYGYTEIEYDIVAWVKILDEDGEVCEVVQGSVGVTSSSDETIKDAIGEKAQQNRDEYHPDI